MLFYAHTKIDGDEHECARKLLFSLIEKHLPELAGAVLCRDGNGAPYLCLGGIRAEKYFVSLSHSHGMCAAAISDTPVGVDIELVREMKAKDKLEARFMGKLRMPRGIEEKEYPFFHKWTYLEACFKVTQKYDTPLPVCAHEKIEANGGEYVVCVVKE